MSSTELEMRRRREPDELLPGDYEFRLHKLWKAENRLREEKDPRYAERLARTKEEIYRHNERAHAARRHRVADLH